MQKVKQYATSSVATLVCMGFMANAGATFQGARMADGANVSIFGQAVFWAACGLVSMAFAGWKLPKAGAVQSSTFDDDMESVRHLAESLNEYEDASEPLRAISDIALQKEMEPDA